MTSLLDKLDRIEGEAGLGAILLLLLLTMFVVSPAVATGALPLTFVEYLRFALAAITVIVVAQTARVRLLVAIAFIGTVLASMHWRVGEPPATVWAIKLGLGLMFDVVVAGTVAVVAFGPGRVTVFRILGAVILYLYVALIFAGLFRIEAQFLANAFSNLPESASQRFSSLLAFSLGALTTNGGGDISALHPLARSLANLEAVIGQLFPATLLARLVTLHAAGNTESD
ncbi:hypothetical protein FHS31_002454 [Sphingomonas vulcanisoli]|uniref:Uncharacterized protein n=1 Tax=Sphingomonas vulcanisoli TaxID=1658060 RepID=A0ABX0TYK0_9SPHN|nr:hypothetical protein [Sphingomonas vulcanisoli]NIJ08830.1 hypothetical protein [Sphingomonas vulcanisoli]